MKKSVIAASILGFESCSAPSNQKVLNYTHIEFDYVRFPNPLHVMIGGVCM